MGTKHTPTSWTENADEIDRLKSVNDALVAALEAAIERMESVADSIPVSNRAKGVSQATHVLHMAGHLAQHAKIARAALELVKGK